MHRCFPFSTLSLWLFPWTQRRTYVMTELVFIVCRLLALIALVGIGGILFAIALGKIKV
jgi:hypothetical protein